MKKQIQSFLFATALGTVGAFAADDCVALSQTVDLEIAADKSLVLEIVSKHVAASPACSCQVVKSAIKATKADSATVAAIVESAITAAPEHSRLITQCAIATAPDAAAAVQAVLAKLDPNSGESVASSKSGKAPAETAPESWNPLDLPGDSTSKVGIRQGDGDGGSSYLRPGLQFNTPPIIDTPVVTNPNPKNT